MQSKNLEPVPIVDLSYDFSNMQGRPFFAVSTDPKGEGHKYHFNYMNEHDIVIMCTKIIHKIMSDGSLE